MDADTEPDWGVGPHPAPWPSDARFDPDLLRDGDRRNVVDRFRYWSNEAIVAELARSRHSLSVAIENFQHDFNIGSVIRTANAFNVERVHVVGKRRWNRRGAMVTDRYLALDHHDGVADFVSAMSQADLPLIGIDNVDGAQPLETYPLPTRCVMVFGQEGPGLTPPMQQGCDAVLAISQFGSTRSMNVGAAAAIAMHAWIRQHAFGQSAPDATSAT